MTDKFDKLQARVCSICGRPMGTVAFTLLLKWLGFTGHYAHPRCINREQRKRKLR